jgi:hypothetical protein
MEFFPNNKVRVGYKTDIHESCIRSYDELQAKYEFKNKEMIEYKTKANYWEAQFRQLKTREGELVSENEELKAKLRKREQELFGRSSEKTNKKQDGNPQSKKEQSKRNRGQQPGNKGHGRRDYSDLPIVEEEVGIAKESCRCPCCHLPYEELPGYAESDILEVEVKAHRRIIYRKKYKRQCSCKRIQIRKS